MAFNFVDSQDMMKLLKRLHIVLVPIAFMVGQMSCEDDEEYPSFEVRSPSFGYGETIPVLHTCKGVGQSPLLTFSYVPLEALTFAVIMEDADALLGKYTNWLIWNLEAPRPLEEGAGLVPPEGAQQGLNDGGLLGYLAPCPSTGGNHRYFFHVYALNKTLELNEGADRRALERAMKHHIVGKGELMGLARP